MISFAVYNIKGGVGKTTSCVNLAYLAAKDGFKTLLWDLDAQGAATFYLGENSSVNGSLKGLIKQQRSIPSYIYNSKFENLSYIPGHIKNRKIDLVLGDLKNSKKQFKSLFQDIKNDFDYAFLDCPPTLNLLAENLFQSANYILLPIVPSALSERTYHQVLDFFEEKNLDLRKIVPFFNLVDLRRNLHKLTIQNFKETQPKCLREFIPNHSVIENMGTHKAPIFEFAPKSEAAFAYRNLWQELKTMKKLKSRKLFQNK